MDWKYSIQNFDNKLVQAINSLHSPWLDEVMLFLSAKTTWLPLYVGLVLLVIFKFKKQSWFCLLCLAVCVFITDRFSSGVAKPFFERLRPCYNDDLVLYLLTSCGGKYGFFSSHAANAFGLSVYISCVLKNKLFGSILYILAVLVAISRVYLGKHYFTDILVGSLFGSLVAYIIYCVFRYGLNKKFFKL